MILAVRVASTKVTKKVEIQSNPINNQESKFRINQIRKKTNKDHNLETVRTRTNKTMKTTVKMPKKTLNKTKRKTMIVKWMNQKNKEDKELVNESGRRCQLAEKRSLR